MPRRNTGGFLSTKEQATDANSANGIFTTQEAAALTAAGSFPLARSVPSRSLRMRSEANPYFWRTPPAAPTSATTWTMSLWFKRTVPADASYNRYFFSAYETVGWPSSMHFSGDNLALVNCSGGSQTGGFTTNRVFRDPSAWYHVVWVWDTTNPISSDRQRLYINGVRETSLSSVVTPSLNAVSTVNKAGVPQLYGYYYDYLRIWGGYLSELYMVDGQALDASYFGRTDAETGSWIPKSYTGSFGNNGYYLPFSNPTQYTDITSTASATAPFGGTVASITSANGVYMTTNTSTGSSFTVAQYDFGAPVQITQFLVGALYFTGGSSTFQVQTSNDGSTWVSSGSLSVTGSGQNFYGNINIAVRYVRLQATAFGTNGQAVVDCFLLYQDGITLDASGTGNSFSPFNISTTAGATFDSMVDVPGIASVSAQPDIGGVVRGNYATLNPLYKGYGAYTAAPTTLSGGNLTSTSTSGVNNVVGTMEVFDKCYWETTWNTQGNNNGAAGIINTSGQTVALDGYYDSVSVLGTSVASMTFNVNDVIGIAVDKTAGTVDFYRNGVFGYKAIVQLNDQSWFPWIYGALNDVLTINFGQRPFAYTPPLGFKCLCTTNLPNPVIKRPSDHFDVKVYSGNGVAQQIGANSKQVSTFSTSALRFKAESSTELRKSLAASFTNKKKWTLSFWVKKSRNDKSNGLGILSSDASGAGGAIQFAGNGGGGVSVNDDFNLSNRNATTGTSDYTYRTKRLFKDQNIWNHIVVVMDTTLSSSTDRLKVFANGVRDLNYGSDTAFPALNYESTALLGSSNLHRMGFANSDGGNAGFFDGYLSEFIFVDGQALTPESFGAFDANNSWVAQRYTGTYGNNGFYLPFSKPSDVDVMSYGVSLNGSNQWLSVPTGTSTQFGTGDFTIEMWVNPTTLNSSVFTVYSSVTNYLTGGGNGYPLNLNINENGSMQISGASPDSNKGVQTGAWNHIAYSKVSGTGRIFINGKLALTWSDTNNYSASNGSLIGKRVVDGNEYYGGSGYISNLRIVKGTGLYTSNFVPSTSPLTAVSGTSLLTCQAATIIDASTNAFTITNNNTVTVIDASPWQRTVGYDAGNSNNWTPINFDYSVPRSTVVTYGTPGTYTWVAPAGVTSVKALVVAGGGAGGSNGGGGGAGGMVYNAAVSVTPGSSYTVTVGKGGLTRNLGNAGNSVFSSITAVAGGNGATYGVVAAQNGGSGGGGSLSTTTPGTGTAGQGNAGGAGNNGNSGNTYYHGGGGGAGGAGAAGGTSTGGAGLVNSITGVPLYYAGGGAGHYFVTNTQYYAAGGIGGGGSGQNSRSGPTAGGTPNTGGGGGGTASGLGGGPGGTGVVILSYTNAASYTGTGANSIESMDAVTDSPTNFEDSNGSRGNYATLDIKRGNKTYTGYLNGALTAYATDDSATNFQAVYSTLGFTKGKYYAEFRVNSFGSNTNSLMFGVASWDYGTNTNNHNSTEAGNTVINLDNSTGSSRDIFVDGVATGYTSGTSWAAGDICGIAVDADLKKAFFYKNNTLLNSTGASISAVNNQPFYFTGYVRYNGSSSGFTANFGQQGFVYTPPTGYKALNTKTLQDVGSFNLPDSFGNYVNTPDLVWLKNRSSGSYGHRVTDTLRGPFQQLLTHDTGAQSTDIGGVNAFTPNGFSVGAGSDYNIANNSFVSWAWNRGQTPGFDIVNYSGNSTNSRMIPHNLGQTPAFYITKNLSSYNSSNGFNDWSVWHKDVDVSSYGGNKALWLHSTITAGAAGGFYNNPTSTHFGPNQTLYDNVSGQSYIAYLWAEVPGFSKFGKYIGNGSASGPFVYTGFRPRWIMIKNASNTTNYNWYISDTERSKTNPVAASLAPNSAAAEDTAWSGGQFDILSNGFRVRISSAETNGSGNTFIYAAFAESPFKYANAR